MLTPALPIAPTPLIARLTELEAIDVLLTRADIRLVTVLGPAGVGKTRVALEAAHRLAARSVEVLFVPLADLVDPSQVPVRLLEALGEADVGGRLPLEVVADRLTSRSVVLVLDNK
jgi:predicted ATPase